MIDTNKTLIGRLERVDFPSLGVFGLDAKVDTGAYSGSIHVSYIKEVDSKLIFKILDEDHPEYQNKEYEMTEFTKKKVISSNGVSELRYFIKIPLTLGQETFTTTFNLSNRKSMRRPVLLGRKNIRKRYVVDAGKTYVLSSTTN